MSFNVIRENKILANNNQTTGCAGCLRIYCSHLIKNDCIPIPASVHDPYGSGGIYAHCDRLMRMCHHLRDQMNPCTVKKMRVWFTPSLVTAELPLVLG